MGQLALGFRSLLIKVAIFFVMASLLAWALGGTLWPRAEIVDLPGAEFDGRTWFWRLRVGGRSERPMSWTMMQQAPDEDAEAEAVAQQARKAEAPEPQRTRRSQRRRVDL